MRLCREIPKLDKLECEELDDSWCALHQCWCYKITKCKTKTEVVADKKSSKAHRPYSIGEYKAIDNLFKRGVEIDANQVMKLAKKFDRTMYAILKAIYNRRKLLTERGKIC